MGTFVLVVQKTPPQIEKEFLVGEPAPRSVFAPVRLLLVDEEKTGQLRREKEAAVFPVYSQDPKIRLSVHTRLEELLKNLNDAEKRAKLESFSYPWPLSPPTRELLLDVESRAKVFQTVKLLVERLFREGILEDTEKKKLIDSAKTRIQKVDSQSGAEEVRDVKDLASISDLRPKALLLLDRERIKNRKLREASLEIFAWMVQPNLFFDESKSKERVKRALDAAPPIAEEIKRGEMIVQKGLLVTPDQQEKLIQAQKKMSQEEARSRLLTNSIFVFLALAFSFLYLRQFEPKGLLSPSRVILVFTVFLVTLALEKAALLLPASAPHLLPAALAAILLTILWNPTVGILGALALPILSAPLVEFRLEVILMLFVGSLMGVFSAYRIRKRIHFLRIGLAVGLVNVILLFGYSSFLDWRLSEALSLSPLAFANSFLTAALAFFLVPLIESLFNLTTDITLLELSDLNHPLLKRMVMEAPGTYHHSLVVSTLAESACEAVGANALLARVGSYFHDIGKIARSEYFTENQTPQTGDQHSKLTPSMSCLVIMNHVKEGIELAKKYKLKDIIVHFIPEHQGTGVIYYFYKKALDSAEPGKKVNPDDFRYPGPKPQSRETAVVLLADSIEAASRSLKEKDLTPAGIRSVVRKVINDKFIDGQLDDCDLTLKDLHKIQESFVHNLMAIFHTRVSYPPNEADPKKPDLFAADQFAKFR